MIIEEEGKKIETSSHSKGGCCSGGELRSKLQAMNLTPSVHSHSDTVTLNETALQKYEKYIDFYLSNKYKEKLKYQKYGLIDFYYALRQDPSDQSSENSIESM